MHKVPPPQKKADTGCKLSWKEWVFFVLWFNQSQILFNYCPVCLKADRRNLWKPSCKAWLFIDVNWLRKWSNPKERTESIAILCQSVMSSLGGKRKHLSSLPCCRLNRGVKSKAIFKSFFVQGFFPPHFYFFLLIWPKWSWKSNRPASKHLDLNYFVHLKLHWAQHQFVFPSAHVKHPFKTKHCQLVCCDPVELALLANKVLWCIVVGNIRV